jgi:hypothetical protein
MSLERSTHEPPQLWRPSGQLHEPLKQLLPAAHATPQPPQFAGSEAVATHDCPQAVSPEVHVAAQCPSEQTWPEGQAVPHAPQFIGSAETSTHAPLQEVAPGRQPEHLPSLQATRAGHAEPQLPQLAMSALGSMQVPLQGV